MREVLEALAPKTDGIYVDGTIGGGGHAAALLKASSPTGRLFGCDRDGDALEAARERLREFEGRFELRRGNFTELPGWVAAGSCDGILLDLGVSSPQLDWPERGFSFSREGPLDMRMDRSQVLTAAGLVNAATADELAKIFWELGDESNSRRIARAIKEVTPLQTTKQLADVVEKVSPRGPRKSHPATKVFQALRMAVNDELGSLRRGLEGVLGLLKPGGRLAVITFHSLEDRLVKDVGKGWSRDYTPGGPEDVPELRTPGKAVAKWVSRKAIPPDETEVAENPRARSAQLRVLEKI
jgi:16S rRNA (cytosine1402-N4)-methyltransferase